MRSPHILLACLLASIATLLQKPPTYAQITPDQTLGAESSVIRSEIEINGDIADLIEGGATRGENLFHSFSEFNVGNLERVYFASPANIQTILGRVTGNDLSNIDGLLGTTGESNAALVLMNPNGIVFGENASLDTQGAFTATTATSIRLGENGFFSAIAPDDDRLLSVNPSAFFFSELGRTSSDISLEGAQIQFTNEEAFLLLGSNVEIDSAGINAPNSQVDVIAIGDATTATLSAEGAIALSEQGRGSILVGNGSFIDVRSPTGGTVRLIADDIQVLSGSLLLSGARPTLDQASADDGDALNFVELDATGFVQISGAGTVLESSVLESAVGDANGVAIKADSIEVSDGAQVYTITLGQGSAGNVNLSANSNISLDAAQIYSSVALGAIGQGGELSFSAKDTSMTGNASISTFTSGEGDAGNITFSSINSLDISSLSGGEPIVFSSVGLDGTGQGGSLSFSAEDMSVTGSVIIATFTSGEGDAGDINFSSINSLDISSLSGGEPIVFSSSNESSNNDGGNINVVADNLRLEGSGLLGSINYGRGATGNILIEVVNNVRLNRGSDSALFSILSVKEGDGSNEGGDIIIGAGNVDVLGGFQVSTSTRGPRESGNVQITAANNLRIAGTNPVSDQPSASLVGTLSSSGTGNTGDVILKSGTLEVLEGGTVAVTTASDGDAGNITIDVVGTATLDGIEPRSSFLSVVRSNSSLNGSGNGGTIQLSAGELRITNGAQIQSGSVGSGNAGKISVDVAGTVLIDGVDPITKTSPSSIASDVFEGGTGQGGDVEVVATDLKLSNGGDLSSSTFGQGDAGSVRINVSESVLVDGANFLNRRGPSGIRSGVQQEGKGNGGLVEIVASDVTLINGGEVSTSVFGEGDAGDVIITVTDALRVDGLNPANLNNASAIGSNIQSGAVGQGGIIRIAAGSVEATNGANISTSVFGIGDAGDVFVDASGSVLISGKSATRGGTFPSVIGSAIEAAGRGQGGNVEIRASDLSVLDEGLISSAAAGEGDSGSIVLDVDNRILVEDDADITTLSSLGSGGIIQIQTESILLRENGDISTFVREGTGTGGSIEIEADYVVALEDSDILAFSEDGRGGNIDLSKATLFSQNINFGAENLTEDALNALSGNEEVNINASGSIASGQILINDTSFIEEDLAELPDTPVDTDALIANACIAQAQDNVSTFVVRGSDRTPLNPNDSLPNSYSLGTIQTISESTSVEIQEPTAFYKLPNGRIIMSHRCET